jgi:CRP-like cAMP-binding protein
MKTENQNPPPTPHIEETATDTNPQFSREMSWWSALWNKVRRSDERLKVVAAHRLFEGLSPYQINKCVEMGHMRSLANGEVLFRQGEKGQLMYVLLEGAVELRCAPKGSGWDGETVSAVVLNAPTAFGESGLLGDLPRQSSAQVVEAAVVWILSAADLREWVMINPKLGAILWRNLAALGLERAGDLP